MKLPQGQETVKNLGGESVQPGSKCCIVGCRKGDVDGRKVVFGERSSCVREGGLGSAPLRSLRVIVRSEND